MRTLTGRYTNFYRDREVWTGSLVTGGSPSDMDEAVAEIVALHHSAPDLVYWSTIVEHDGPGGGTVVSAIDLSEHANDLINADDDRDADEHSGETSWSRNAA